MTNYLLFNSLFGFINREILLYSIENKMIYFRLKLL